ncbi:VOC family protein [Thalassotalea marina]|uniref:Glyoxalase n=1 Tax=Thalassotalea marina TaxID=1673741 RepID=A0A919BPQ6_9GAMM|nr:VOC family protein [Thalassotalea marina]GHG06104.1 glyoxalase [Thalassotalea marina]
MKQSYTVVGTNNLANATKYYDALFQETEFKRVIADERMTYWGCDWMMFAVASPYNKEAATNGNGTMIGLNLNSTEEVDNLYQKAIALGGSCEGEPKLKGPYYSAYVRDLDKNKLCLFFQVA